MLSRPLVPLIPELGSHASLVEAKKDRSAVGRRRPLRGLEEKTASRFG
jgi:hypothetical protein